MMNTSMRMSRDFACGLLFLAGLVALAPLAYADYQTAAKAYQDKNYDKALVEFRELAELGHPDSQYALGVMYYQGQGANKNPMLAYGWIRLAADAGNAKAKDLEPKIRAQMEDESVDRARGILDKFTPTAVQSRLLPKVIENCEYYKATAPKKKSLPTPIYPSAAIAQGISGSVLLEFFIETDGTVRDVRVIEAIPGGTFDESVRATAFKWTFEPAMRNGRPFATWAETYVIFKVDKSSSLTSESVKHVAQIKKLAEEGNPSAQYFYGLILAGHPQYMKPWSEVLPWMMKAAQGGSAPAQFRVAQSLLRGRGCEPDSGKASEWLLRSAQQDFPDAQVELAKLALKTGAGYDPKKGVFWLERAAVQNNINSQKYLAAVLAASPDETLRDSARALGLIDVVLKKDRGDILAQEIRAAALAASGKFADATTAQTKALVAAERRSWDLTDLNQRLETYQSGKAWYGDLLTF